MTAISHGDVVRHGSYSSFLLLTGTGILPVGAKSGAEAEAGQDKAVEDEPPGDNDDQKQTFVHDFPCSPLPVSAWAWCSVIRGWKR